MVAQLKHVRIILSQDGDGVTLLPDDQPRLLLICIAKVDSIKLKTAMNHCLVADMEFKCVCGRGGVYLKELVPVL